MPKTADFIVDRVSIGKKGAKQKMHEFTESIKSVGGRGDGE